MHLMIAIQEELPDQKMTGPIGDFVREMFSRQYTVPFVKDPWAKIRPREIRFFDFTIPAAIEEDVLFALAPFVGGKIQKLSKIAKNPILKGLIEKTIGLKTIDMNPYIKMNSDPQKRQPKNISVRLVVLGKIEDDYINGMEMI